MQSPSPAAVLRGGGASPADVYILAAVAAIDMTVYLVILAILSTIAVSSIQHYHDLYDYCYSSYSYYL